MNKSTDEWSEWEKSLDSRQTKEPGTYEEWKPTLKDYLKTTAVVDGGWFLISRIVKLFKAFFG